MLLVCANTIKAWNTVYALFDCGKHSISTTTNSKSFTSTRTYLFRTIVDAVASQESGNNDCLWESDPDVPVQLSSLKLHLNQGHLSSGGKNMIYTYIFTVFNVGMGCYVYTDFLKELQLEVEIWSSFLS